MARPELLSLVVALADIALNYLKMSGGKDTDKMTHKAGEADSLTKEKPPTAAEQGGGTKESAPTAKKVSTENQSTSSTNTELRTGEGGTIGRIISQRPQSGRDSTVHRLEKPGAGKG